MTFRFEGYELDIARYSLRRDGRDVAVEPRVLELLDYLISQRRRLIDKRELLDVLWPEEFVGDAVLTRSVYLARQALGDTSRTQRFIKTVRGRGYTFNDSVKVESVRSIVDHDAAMGGQEPVDVLVPVSHATATGMELTLGSHRYPLINGENVIGRAPDVAIQLNASGVSRRHARIVVSGNQAILEDLSSKNGTFLRGRRLDTSARLADGDTIGVGRAVLVLREVSPYETTITEFGHLPED